MTNKLFLSLVTVAVASTTLLNVQSSHAVDVVSTTGFASTTATPVGTVSTAAAVSVGYGKNASAGSGAVTGAAKGAGSATAIGGADAGNASVGGSTSANVTTTKKVTTADAGALVRAAGNGSVAAGSTTFTSNGYGSGTGVFSGISTSPVNVGGYISKERPNIAGTTAIGSAGVVVTK